MTTTTAPSTELDVQAILRQNKKPLTAGRLALHVFLSVMALIWLFPVLWAVFNAFRDYSYTSEHGYLSFGGWTVATSRTRGAGQLRAAPPELDLITVPAVILTLFLSSAVAFVIARFSWRFNLLPARPVPRREPAAAAGPAHPAVPDVRAVPLPAWMNDQGSMHDSYWR